MGKTNENWAPCDYRTLQDLASEIDRIEESHHAGTLQAAGGWSAGQILEHTSNLMQCSIDGFDASAPLPIRVLGTLFFKPMLGRSHMKPGIKLPKSASSLLPRDVVEVEEGIAKMRSVLARIDAGEQMTQRSPVLGKMSHEQWVKLHLDHCRLHFGFLRIS